MIRNSTLALALILALAGNTALAVDTGPTQPPTGRGSTMGSDGSTQPDVDQTRPGQGNDTPGMPPSATDRDDAANGRPDGKMHDKGMGEGKRGNWSRERDVDD
ncbi:hypothetical protein [uncultured Pseudomonas sp.]|uniref:hypothetical protein n=1 Tax=uncultured Pseudomonas sp. TaxID=114707 RepID=UPI0025E779C0|nr:hypothetical protein [uncultured Pseudomonas sp.]